jgi:hypothetical protein
MTQKMYVCTISPLPHLSEGPQQPGWKETGCGLCLKASANSGPTGGSERGELWLTAVVTGRGWYENNGVRLWSKLGTNQLHSDSINSMSSALVDVAQFYSVQTV